MSLPHIDTVCLLPADVPTFCSSYHGSHPCRGPGKWWSVAPDGTAVSMACQPDADIQRETLKVLRPLPDVRDPYHGEYNED